MRTCPQCQSTSGIRKIVYGYPDSSEAFDVSEYVLGGCCISEYDPTIKCIDCGWLGEYKSYFIPGLVMTRQLDGEDSYWIQSGMDGEWFGGLHRYFTEDGFILEQRWGIKEKVWIPTTHLTRMLSGGECTLERIPLERAKQLVPLAFQESKEIK